jgi:2-iminobutanoate/2-iminopropanoate deaminase
VYLKHAADFDAMNGAYREAFTGDLPVRTTVVTDLRQGASVELSAIAVASGIERQVLHPPGWMKSPRPYSYGVRANGLVFFAGLVSRRPTDDQVIAGTTPMQTRTILDNAGALLKAAGLQYSDVVSSRVYIIDDLYFEDMNAEYRKVFVADPPARATAVTDLMGTDAHVEISLVAAADGMEPFGPSVWPTLPISTATRAGRVSFLSGVMGNLENNRGDAAAQAREAFTRIAHTLGSSGLSLADVADCTIFLPDLYQAAKVDAVFKDVFPHDPPARTMVGAKLATRDAAVEILVTAVK